MRFRLWPRTLAVQLILVVAAAVAVSNMGVAFYYYKNSEAQARDYINERMVDRAAAVAAMVMEPVIVLMTRRMLLGIKERAERGTRAHVPVGPAPHAVPHGAPRPASAASQG